MKRTNFNNQSQVVDETPFCDFSEMDRMGVITIYPARQKEHKTQDITIGGFKGKSLKNASSQEQDVREKRYWFGILLGTNPDGSYKFKKIKILDGRMYYLSNAEDAKEWHIVKHHFKIQGSPNLMGRPNWFVKDESQIAAKSIVKAEGIIKVYDFIKNMTDAKLKDFCRLFEMNPDNNTPEVIRGTLVQIAIDDPGKFNQYMEDDERTNISVVFERGLSTNHISYTGNERGYVYMGVPLGLSKVLAIDYLRRNTDMLNDIDARSKGQDFYESRPLLTPNVEKPKEEEEKVSTQANVVLNEEKQVAVNTKLDEF